MSHTIQMSLANHCTYIKVSSDLKKNVWFSDYDIK